MLVCVSLLIELPSQGFPRRRNHRLVHAGRRTGAQGGARKLALQPRAHTSGRQCGDIVCIPSRGCWRQVLHEMVSTQTHTMSECAPQRTGMAEPAMLARVPHSSPGQKSQPQRRWNNTATTVGAIAIAGLATVGAGSSGASPVPEFTFSAAVALCASGEIKKAGMNFCGNCGTKC